MRTIVEENAPQPAVTDAPKQTFDYVLVGGGLQSGLIALALRHHQPNASLLIVEKSGQLAGNHTWSFHTTDLSGEMAAWIDGVVEHRWPDMKSASEAACDTLRLVIVPFPLAISPNAFMIWSTKVRRLSVSC